MDCHMSTTDIKAVTSLAEAKVPVPPQFRMTYASNSTKGESSCWDIFLALMTPTPFYLKKYSPVVQ